MTVELGYARPKEPNRMISPRFPRKYASYLFLLVASAPLLGHAASPSLEGLFPAGVARGAANVVTVVGKQEAWPPKVWVSNPGVSFSAQTNKGKFLVYVQPDAVLGPCLVRFYNEEGASEPRILVVDANTGVADAEPNNHFAKAQILQRLPATIDGRLEKNGDVDSFSVALKSGQWLKVSVDSYTLMSKVDAALRLVTTNGVQLAWNHDFTTLDPRLIWRADSNQTVVLQIFGFAYPPGSDIRLAGGETAIYRLHINELDHEPEPGKGTPKNNAREMCGDCRSNEMPFSIQGRITRGDEEQRFPFFLERGDIIEARIEASSFGSPLDAWLRVEDGAGTELVRNDDDGGTPDPRLEWKVPTNGTFHVVIGSVTHRGGEDFRYRLTVQRLAPAFRVTFSSSLLTLNAGTTNEVKFDLKRLHGHTNELVASVHGLPPCVTNLTGSLPTKDGIATIQLAADEACEFQGPIQVTVKDTVTGDERRVSFHLTSRGENTYVRLLVESCEDFWLTVRPRPVEAKAKEEKP